MHAKLIPAAALLAGVVLFAAACGGYGGGSKTTSSKPEGGGTTTVAGQAANDHGVKDVSHLRSVEVEMDDYYFQPTELKGQPGQSITVELSNEGSVEHNFTLAAQHVDQNVESGKKAEVKITIPRSGVLSFYCKFHRSQGMAGGLLAAGTQPMSSTQY